MAGERILVIEDVRDLLQGLRDVLELSGYRVLTAENGTTGLALAREHHPDLVLCDWSLPDEGGGAMVVRRLDGDRTTHDIPVIVLTTQQNFHDARRYNATVDDFVIKPFDAPDLLTAIDSALRRAEARNLNSPPLIPEPLPGTVFTALFPQRIASQVWQPLYTLVFRIPRTTKPRVRPSAPLDVMAAPRLNGVEFDPPTASQPFPSAGWQQFAFQFRATDVPPGERIVGQIMYTMEGILIGRLPFVITIDANAAPGPLNGTAIACGYERIYPCFSGENQIVRRLEAVSQALGQQYLVDVINAPVIDDWDFDDTKKDIDKADSFQLFWNEYTATLTALQEEWRYALSLPGRPPDFIRAVYWETPMPPVPPELAHVPFDYDPSLAVP